MSSFAKSLYAVYAGILIISIGYFLQDFQETHNYATAWLMQWSSMRQWALSIPAMVVGVLIAKEEMTR
jgi:hypothetical protein